MTTLFCKLIYHLPFPLRFSSVAHFARIWYFPSFKNLEHSSGCTVIIFCLMTNDVEHLICHPPV